MAVSNELVRIELETLDRILALGEETLERNDARNTRLHALHYIRAARVKILAVVMALSPLEDLEVDEGFEEPGTPPE